MRLKCLMVLSVFVVLSALMTADVQAYVIIHEFLADPAGGPAGDANGDGVRDSSDDEFIELFNASAGDVNLDGWSLTDSTDTVRHLFGSDAWIKSGGLFVVFGGGSPALPLIAWDLASTGSLGLNNGGDVITLYDADRAVADQVVYGAEGGKNQSLTRYPEGARSSWIWHSGLPGANGQLFSPGRLTEVPDKASPATTPEPLSALSFMIGLGASFWIKKINCYD